MFNTVIDDNKTCPTPISQKLECQTNR